jgi:hypothetical protein
MPTTITLTITQAPRGPVTVSAPAGAADLDGPTDIALIARCMLQSAAYQYAAGMPTKFSDEIPADVLK